MWLFPGHLLTCCYDLDRDGDEVRIGSDEELLEALMETKQIMKQAIFKIYIKAEEEDDYYDYNYYDWVHSLRLAV